ncbi:MAG: glutamate--tRNA ligase, partial [Ruminococcaceae bacterium]|nr:glutamate--tRNA ligase [Oscillospiraceae bacterium]
MDHQALAELLFPHVTDTPADVQARYPHRDLSEGAIVTRMAPSPTGFVHLGNLVMGLTAERMAHQSGGVLFLRVEDTDAKREVPGAVEVLINTLKHYGIQFDEGAVIDGDNGHYGPYRQRQRASIYHVFAKQLVLEGKAYPCFCTEEELAAMREQQEAAKENFGYYGKYATWRDRPLEDIQAQLAAGNPWVLRFRSEGSIENQFKFDDLVKGKLTITENDIDHVLLKSDGIPTYHFAHAVDDELMRTTHVVRGDEWLATLPFHIQLFKALGFKLPKYVHIGPLMKMDGTSKRKLSKRKDPELALTFYKAEGFPVKAVYEYIMTVLNSNFEDWRRANPDAPTDDFKFSPKKLNPAGSLFDYAKLVDVSKNVISRMTAEEVYGLLTEWALEFDPDFGAKLAADPTFATAILAIGRGGKKPRKDLAVWKDAKDYMGFFYDEYLTAPVFDEKFDKATVKTVLEKFVASYDPADDSTAWFDKVKAITTDIGFTTDM